MTIQQCKKKFVKWPFTNFNWKAARFVLYIIKNYEFGTKNKIFFQSLSELHHENTLSGYVPVCQGCYDDLLRMTQFHE